VRGCGPQEIHPVSILDRRRERPELGPKAGGIINRFGFQLPCQQQECHLRLGIPAQVVNNCLLLVVEELVPSAGQGRLLENAIQYLKEERKCGGVGHRSIIHYYLA